MYNKKRIVIQKNNLIVLAGGRSWIPVGFIRVNIDGLALIAEVFKDKWARSKGTEEITALNKK